MNSQKFVLAGVAAGIVSLLLGWVVYGMLLKDFMANNLYAPNMMKKDEDTIWWSLIVGQLLMGFFLAYIIGKANANSPGAGATIGFVAGLLVCLGVNLTMYGVTNFMGSMKGIAADVIVTAIITAIGGAVVGWVYGMKRAVATA
jgi:hypothetical protein